VVIRPIWDFSYAQLHLFTKKEKIREQPTEDEKIYISLPIQEKEKKRGEETKLKGS